MQKGFKNANVKLKERVILYYLKQIQLAGQASTRMRILFPERIQKLRGYLWLRMLRSDSANRFDLLCLFQIVTIRLHHLRPRRYEIAHKFFLIIILCIDFRVGTQD